MRRAAPRITRIEDLASSALFSLEEIDVEFGNGSIRTFERWKERWPHTVIMVAVNEAQEVLLVWEFVAGLGRRVLRLPSGRVERGESPASAARRELCEEVGFDSGRHRIIHRFYNEPGHSDAFRTSCCSPICVPGSSPVMSQSRCGMSRGHCKRSTL